MTAVFWTMNCPALYAGRPTGGFPGGYIFRTHCQFHCSIRGGYPYEYVKTGEINYNDPCYYRRFLFTDGLTLRYRGEGFSMTSITTVQRLDDNMTLDQDFLPEPYFTLTQRQHETSVTEDIVFRGDRSDSRYHWLTGAFLFYKAIST